MKLKILPLILLLLLPISVNANIICNDGTISPTCTTCRAGCCSYHGGCSNNQQYEEFTDSYNYSEDCDCGDEDELREENEQCYAKLNEYEEKYDEGYSFNAKQFYSYLFDALLIGAILLNVLSTIWNNRKDFGNILSNFFLYLWIALCGCWIPLIILSLILSDYAFLPSYLLTLLYFCLNTNLKD